MFLDVKIVRRIWYVKTLLICIYLTYVIPQNMTMNLGVAYFQADFIFVSSQQSEARDLVHKCSRERLVLACWASQQGVVWAPRPDVRRCGSWVASLSAAGGSWSVSFSLTFRCFIYHTVTGHHGCVYHPGGRYCPHVDSRCCGRGMTVEFVGGKGSWSGLYGR